MDKTEVKRKLIVPLQQSNRLCKNIRNLKKKMKLYFEKEITVKKVF